MSSKPVPGALVTWAKNAKEFLQQYDYEAKFNSIKKVALKVAKIGGLCIGAVALLPVAVALGPLISAGYYLSEAPKDSLKEKALIPLGIIAYLAMGTIVVPGVLILGAYHTIDKIG